MNPVALAFAIAVPAAFVAGVVFHSHAISQAQSIKEHVTAEIEEVRAHIHSLLDKAASKVG